VAGQTLTLRLLDKTTAGKYVAGHVLAASEVVPRNQATPRGTPRYPPGVAEPSRDTIREGGSSGSPTPSRAAAFPTFCDDAPSLGRGVGPPGVCGVQDRASRSGGTVSRSRSPDLSVSLKLSRVDRVSASQHDHPFVRADSVDGKERENASSPAEEATGTNDDLVRAVSVPFVPDPIKPADLVAVVAKNPIALGRCKQATEVSLASETGSLDALFGHQRKPNGGEGRAEPRLFGAGGNRVPWYR
jgi:hypothetical protein